VFAADRRRGATIVHDLQEQTNTNLGQRRKRRHAVTALLLAIVLVGTALRLYQLDADSLWRDEMLTSRKSQDDLLSVITYIPRYTHPPLVDVVTWVLIALSGNSDFVVRAQAMLFGSLSILLTYRLGQMLWTREVGLISAFLLALNAYHIRYSQEARSYALLPFIALLSLIFLLKALERNSKGFWIGFTVCASLSLYTHYFALFYLIAEVIFAAYVITERWLCDQRNNRRALADPLHHRLTALAKQALPLGVSLAIACLSFVPWLPALPVHLAYFPDAPQGGVSIVAGLEKSLGLLRVLLVDYCGADIPVLLLWVVLFVLGLVACDRARLTLVASWVAAPFVFLALPQSNIPAIERTVIFLLPLCLIVVARGITSAARSLGGFLPRVSSYRRGLAAVMVALGILLILASASLASVKEYYLWEKRNWRDAGHYLEDSIEPGDIILTDGITYQTGLDAYYIRNHISYYLSSDVVETTPLLPVQRGLASSLEESAPSKGRVWAVVAVRSGAPKYRDIPQQVTLEGFEGVYVLSPRQPSGDLLQDTTAILKSLLVLLRRPHAKFDVHLALAEIYTQQGRLPKAASQLMLAHLTAPDHDTAETDFAEVSGQLAPVLGLHLNQITFGEEFYSLGYRLYPPTPTSGQRITVSFWWKALRAMDRDYTLFIHLVGPDGRIWAQEDALLEYADLGTSAWPVRRLIESEYQLELPADAPSGEYVLHAGVYFWGTGERLPVRDEEGQRAPDDAVTLGTITVSARNGADP
jgi:uncharacterized membrane protein